MWTPVEINNFNYVLFYIVQFFDLFNICFTNIGSDFTAIGLMLRIIHQFDLIKSRLQKLENSLKNLNFSNHKAENKLFADIIQHHNLIYK